MKLIVNADDFGMSEGVNYGIYYAYKNGIVTSTTMLVTTPAVKHARKIAKLMSKIGIGLHLNITFGKPLTNCVSLINGSGNFNKPKENPNQNYFNEEEIYQEFLAQYKLFIKVIGKKPTHIDSHLYAHQKYPKAYKAALRLSNEKKIAIRDAENNNYIKTIFLDKFKYQNKNNLKEILVNELNKMEKGNVYELMVHPAFLDKFILDNSSYTIGRTMELSILIDQEIKNIIKERKIKLINFRQTRRQKCQELI